LEHKHWVQRLALDLKEAGIEVDFDALDNAGIGDSVTGFVQRVLTSEFVIVIGTPLYLARCEDTGSERKHFVADEYKLIQQRLDRRQEQPSTLLPVLREGSAESALPAPLRDLVRADFTREEGYFVALFSLVETMHRLVAHPTLRENRESLELLADQETTSSRGETAATGTEL
jgi:hypothetical protein